MWDRTTPARRDAIAKFWDRYIKTIQYQGITKPSDRWYVLRAQAYIKAHLARISHQYARSSRVLVRDPG